MGKVSQTWVDNPTFKDWLKTVMGNGREAFCSLCKKTINVTWNGIKAIKSHNASSSHQQRLRAKGSSSL
jgi:hypothetical protein